MAAFVFLGSKGGAGRTASSVVLATGLAGIGLRPVHLELTLSRRMPAIASASGLPFATVWLPQEQATREQINRIIRAHSQCSTVVIDTPKQGINDLVLPDLRAAALFPMRRSGHEIEVAVRDYREFQFHLNAPGVHGVQSSLAECSPWLLPVSWPVGLSHHDFELQVALFDLPTRLGSSSPSLMSPGVPDIPENDLDELINGVSFRPSPLISEIAATFARNAMKTCASNLGVTGHFL